MNQDTIDTLALRLHEARKKAKEIPPLSREYADLSVADAYRIQAAGLAYRYAEGERLVGMKMGLTSEAKRKQMNLHSPVYGALTDRMRVAGEVFKLDGSIHPKIEPEIAFRTRRALKGRISRDEALDACEVALPAMEILDSRYTDFKYFSLPDVVADNSSSYMFVLGQNEVPPRSVELPRLKMTMEVNGQLAQAATADAISGDPIISVVQLCEMLAAHDKELPEGSVVLAGAATVAHMLKRGDSIRLIVESLGEVRVQVE